MNNNLISAVNNDYKFVSLTKENLHNLGLLSRIHLAPDHDYTGLIMLDMSDIVIGYGYLDDGYINNVYIMPEFRHKGFGTLLVDELMKRFKGNRLCVNKSKTSLIDFYKSLGFKPYSDDGLNIYMNTCKQDLGRLFEDKRTALISKSQNVGAYKNQKYGKNRFERKKYSKLAQTVQQYNKIDMNEFFKQDTLIVTIPVMGETDNYTVTIKMEGVCSELAKSIKSNNNKLEFKNVIQALTKTFNTADIYTKCTCDDFKYRFAHWNIINNVSVDDTAHDPGPGKGIANPNDDQGRGCKHILLTLANGDWLMKVASVINNYIHYAEEHMQKAFMKAIFPRLYGMPAEEAQEQNIIPEDVDLVTTKDIIEVINNWAKDRGKFKKGSNVNPVQADRLSKEQNKEKDEEKTDDEEKTEKS